MDSSPRRSGIPVPKSTTTILMKRSVMNKSITGNSLDENHQHSNNGTTSSISPNNIEPSSELDVFTLLEENIMLKEEKERLIAKNFESLQKSLELERENVKMSKQLEDLKNQQDILKDQLKQLMHKFQTEIHEGKTLHNIQEQQKMVINDLMVKLRKQEVEHMTFLEASKKAKIKLEELVPDNNQNNHLSLESNDIGNIATMDQLINEIGNIKTYLNTTELQLYEANEKIAELVENQNHLELENDSLKIENANLTNVAKLMTSSMKESVDTSKKMEVALISMKKRNDELVQENKDALDSPTSPKFITTNEQVLQLKEELNQKEAAHTERIVEMTKLMESTIESNYTEEIQVLQLKLEMIENELQLALKRAEKAENELEELKLKQSSNTVISQIDGDKNMVVPPPPPPPLPPPPPPPPPRPYLSLTYSNNSNNVRGKSSLTDGISNIISGRDNNNFQQQLKQQEQVKKPATGMDALIAELRDGRVTLRKNRRASKKNPALEEMFNLLEITRKQNRNSKVLLDSKLLTTSPHSAENEEFV